MGARLALRRRGVGNALYGSLLHVSQVEERPVTRSNHVRVRYASEACADYRHLLQFECFDFRVGRAVDVKQADAAVEAASESELCVGVKVNRSKRDI
jgi:hypothetical protein